MLMSDRRETFLLLLPGLALLVLGFLLPILRMLMLSVLGDDGLSTANFARFFKDSYYPLILWRTVWLSAVITAITAAIGFPLAYIMSRVGPKLRLWLVIMVILPLMTSVVIRTFGWIILLGRGGVVADIASSLGFAGRGFA